MNPNKASNGDAAHAREVAEHVAAKRKSAKTLREAYELAHGPVEESDATKEEDSAD